MTDSEKRSFRSQPSVCPFCGVGCGIEYHPSSGTARGWPAPVNRRGEICPKGAAAFDAVDDDERLTEPLVRDGGRLVKSSWKEAFRRIVEAYSTFLHEDGADALAFFASSNCTNEENYLLQKVARLLGTNNIDNCARLCHSSTVAAMQARFGLGAMTNTLEDLKDADVYFIIGANPAEQHPIIFRSYLLPAIRNGTDLVHIDPRQNDTTRPASLHLPVRPGYDIPLLNSIAATIVDEGLHDEAFVHDRTSGFDEFRSFLEEVDIEENAALSGVDADDLRRAAHLYGEAERAAIITGMGMSQHHCGTDNVHALLNLALLTGNIGKPGVGVNPLRGQNNVQGASDVGALPDVLPGYQSVLDDEARARIADEWGVEPPSTPGLTEVELTHRFGDDIRGAYVFGENPIVTEPNANRVADAFDSLEFLVVHDIFRTETAEYADVVLPGSTWAEKAGTVTNTDRQVMRMRTNADLPGNARRDLDIIRELGSRLTDLEFNYDEPAAVFEEITRVSPIYAGMTYDGIGTASQRWPYPKDASSGVGILHVDEYESGDERATLVPIEHVNPVDSIDDDELVLTTGRVLQHFNSGAVTRRSGVLMRMRSEDVLQIHPDDAFDRGISDGDTVQVENDRGSVTIQVDVTPAIRRGTVFATFHYADPLINTLVPDELDSVAKIPEYKHTATRVTLVTDS
ncbi:formate dehydrogenase subunit alpha [Haladaptatus sp. DFWS20]|uniref:formate dehydrogenase subunit alpha n=1 Tax=Haladaptatus sp. DFWS20 TaxID=3403467 RepID=UPI003EBA0276